MTMKQTKCIKTSICSFLSPLPSASCLFLLRPLSVLARVNKELVNRQTDNTDQGQAIRDRLARFHSELMDLRDALNEAVNNTARADEINNMNEKALEDSQVRWDAPRNALTIILIVFIQRIHMGVYLYLF